MGFSIRKGFKLGPVRLNLSKRGVGYSVGVKGLRVGTSGGKAYLRGGRGPIRFQSSLGSTTRAPTIASLATGSDLRAHGEPRTGRGLLFLFVAGGCGIATLLLIAQAQEQKSPGLAVAAGAFIIAAGVAFVRGLAALAWKPTEELFEGGEPEVKVEQPELLPAAEEFPNAPPVPAQEARLLAERAPWDPDRFVLVSSPMGELSRDDFSMEIVGEEDAQDALEGVAKHQGEGGRFPVRVEVSAADMAVRTIDGEGIGRLRQQDEQKDMAAWMRAHDVSLLCEGMLYRRKNKALQVRLALLPLAHLRASVAFGVYAFVPELRTQALAWHDRIANIMLARYGLAVGELAKGEIEKRSEEVRRELRDGTLKASFQGLVETYL